MIGFLIGGLAVLTLNLSAAGWIWFAARRLGDGPTADYDAPIPLVPADDLMAVADAVQDERLPIHDAARDALDIHLWGLEFGEAAS